MEGTETGGRNGIKKKEKEQEKGRGRCSSERKSLHRNRSPPSFWVSSWFTVGVLFCML
jgi:hypothetical protein